LRTGDVEALERHARMLEAYTREEPLPWSDFYIRRARAMARLVAGDHSQAALAVVTAVQGEARHLGVMQAVPAMEVLLASVAATPRPPPAG
jgi:hypothetical protein